MAQDASKPKIGVDEVVEILQRRIAGNELTPGTPLREIALADDLGTSRPRLREAFGVLEERGLIERIPHHGAVVTRLGAKQIEELFDVREVLEALAVRLATQNAPSSTWAPFRERFGPEAEEAIARNDMEGYIDVVNDFRRRTFEEARNEVLSQSLDRLYDRSRVMVRRLVTMPGRAAAALAEHRLVVEAMIAGDAEQAEHLKRENIRSARKWFRSFKTFIM